MKDQPKTIAHKDDIRTGDDAMVFAAQGVTRFAAAVEHLHICMESGAEPNDWKNSPKKPRSDDENRKWEKVRIEQLSNWGKTILSVKEETQESFKTCIAQCDASQEKLKHIIHNQLCGAVPGEQSPSLRKIARELSPEMQINMQRYVVLGTMKHWMRSSGDEDYRQFLQQLAKLINAPDEGKYGHRVTDTAAREAINKALCLAKNDLAEIIDNHTPQDKVLDWGKEAGGIERTAIFLSDLMQGVFELIAGRESQRLIERIGVADYPTAGKDLQKAIKGGWERVVAPEDTRAKVLEVLGQPDSSPPAEEKDPARRVAEAIIRAADRGYGRGAGRT